MTQFTTTFCFFSSVFLSSDDLLSCKVPGLATFSKLMTFFLYILIRDYITQYSILPFLF
jgi:hypothetical protein